MIRKVIELSEIIDKNCINQESDFEYAGIEGYAEFIGWKLVFFRQNKNSCFYDAVSFFDIEDKEVDLCNTILKKFNFPINFNSEPDDIFRIFGKNYSTDDIIEDCTRYNYKLKENLFLSFGVSKKKITSIEMIFDSKIVNNRTE